jgi:hypothetical protein
MADAVPTVPSEMGLRLKLRLLACACLLCTLVAAQPARAEWPFNGLSLCGTECSPIDPKGISDGAGGMYVAWRDRRSFSETQGDAYVQRITGDGVIAPGWPATGLLLSNLPQNQTPHALALDGSGGVYVVWEHVGDATTNVDLYAQRVLGNGVVAPGWPAGGIPVCVAPNQQWLPQAVPDGSGGLFVAWNDDRNHAAAGTDIYALRLLADGTLAPGWNADGSPIAVDPALQDFVVLAPDGVDGFFAAWNDRRTGVLDTFGQHVLGDGSPAAGWAANGQLLIPGRLKPRIAPNGQSGFYIGCSTIDEIGSDLDYYLQRLTFDGTVVPGWPAQGVQLVTAPRTRFDLIIEPDGFGGVFMSWFDYRGVGADIYALRVMDDGTLAPGWTPNGTQVSGLDGAAEDDIGARLAADGAGGVYLAWEWTVGTTRVRVQHLAADGSVAPGWYPGGIAVTPEYRGYTPQIATDGEGGAIVAWERRAPALEDGIFAQRYVVDGPVPVQLALASAEAEPDRVRLTWQGAAAGYLQAVVERSTGSGGWAPLGVPRADGPDRLIYDDLDVVAGARYAYRLAYEEAGVRRYTGETWVEVPAAFKFALHGLQPNPARGGAVAVAFTLQDAAPATLEALDVAGRQVLVRDASALGPGRHVVRLGDGAVLAPGVYLIRIRQGERTAVVRGVVTR